MKMKKILLLGGSLQQIKAIETAKKLGLFTVLCDYLEDNPGQYHADKFYQISTTDKEAVLDVARKEEIDCIIAYASDPAAPTAAYVAEQMHLPGNPYESVEILCDKEKFRAFQRENGFFAPYGCAYSDAAEALRDLENGKFAFPVIVKPVDSSGSKGVSKIESPDDAEEKLINALSFSRKGRIILEEMVDTCGRQIVGDGFSVSGKLMFSYFADHHFDERCRNPFVPVSGSFPCSLSPEMLRLVNEEIQRLLSLLDMRTAAYNFEVRIDNAQNIYLMEVAPRNGGNFIPEVIRYSCGLDLIEYSVRGAMGEEITFEPCHKPQGFYSYYVVHSVRDGVLDHVEIDTEVRRRHVIEEHITCRPGDTVYEFTGANRGIEILLMKFENMEQMQYMTEHSEEWVSVVLRDA